MKQKLSLGALIDSFRDQDKDADHVETIVMEWLEDQGRWKATPTMTKQDDLYAMYKRVFLSDDDKGAQTGHFYISRDLKKVAFMFNLADFDPTYVYSAPLSTDSDIFKKREQLIKKIDLSKTGWMIATEVAGIWYLTAPNDYAFLDALAGQFDKLDRKSKQNLGELYREQAEKLKSLAQVYEILADGLD